MADSFGAAADDRDVFDVAVVGAGLSGLTAAIRLAEAGMRVVVLEREAQVGGRQRSFELSGFVIDQGFQLINPAYPALREIADLAALDLHPFAAGVQALRGDRLHTLADPRRHLNRIVRTLRDGFWTSANRPALLQPGELMGIAKFMAPAMRRPAQLSARDDQAFGDSLDQVGIHGPLREELLEPFLSGVVADDPQQVSSNMVRFLLTMFALGTPSLAARGASALPEQLAAKARRLGVEIRLQSEVAKIPTSSKEVVLADGSAVQAVQRVIAVGPAQVTQFLDHRQVESRGLSTWWFRADQAPAKTKFIRIDAERRGPVLNTAVMTNVAPSYSPDGSALIQATCLLDPDHKVSGDQVIQHLARLWQAPVEDWELLTRTDVPQALPSQRPPMQPATSMQLDHDRWLIGDHQISGSIQGAIQSGLELADQLVGLNWPRR